VLFADPFELVLRVVGEEVANRRLVALERAVDLHGLARALRFDLLLAVLRARRLELDRGAVRRGLARRAALDVEARHRDPRFDVHEALHVQAQRRAGLVDQQLARP